ncbi:TnsD family Tn7-like transposition protein [Bradyrhizobium sp. Bra64]|uniref:TnsD family Tn7-like transposition protein n=1 Tax=Bradyrhizobium sp. Bra64 TaxID=2926009 RepID=UPI0021191370|nr:TnsD family Tn7-like transposition protein [Bradyrhizobium sp. Bra64]
MASLVLPLPYPDELIYSVFARYFAYVKPSARGSAYRAINNRKTFSIKFIADAGDLASRTRFVWGKSPIEIIEQHTLLPYYGSFLAPQQYLKCVEDFTAGSTSRGNTLIGSRSGSVSQIKRLRFCRTCASEDFARFGETYWRRSHQVGGMFVCTRHGDILTDTDAIASATAAQVLQDATTFIKRSTTEPVTLNERELGLARLVSTKCEEILNGQLSRWTRPNPSKLYERAAVDAGYLIGERKLAIDRLAGNFVAFFFEETLSKLGVRLPPQGAARTRVFSKMINGTGSYHPLLHVLLQIFFEEHASSPSPSLYASQISWKCPNPHAGHDDDFRISDIRTVRRYTRGKKDDHFRAKCPCGFQFTFVRAQESDSLMPLVRSISAYGPNFMKRAQALHLEGKSTSDVARELGITTFVALRLVQGRESTRERRGREVLRGLKDGLRILELRKTWSTTQCVNAYALLRKIDRDWIMDAAKRRREATPRTVIPISDDSKLADRIRRAAKQIRNEEPTGNVTTNLLAIELGIRSLRTVVARLPLAKAALDDVVGPSGGRRKQQKAN